MVSHMSEFENWDVYKRAVLVSFPSLPPQHKHSHGFGHFLTWSTSMSFALPARQITFGRTSNQQQPYQYQQQGLALPGGSAFQQQKPANSLSLPGPSPL